MCCSAARSRAEVKLYRAISQDTPDKMADQRDGRYRAEGYTKFQLKVGGDADVDIERIRACRAVLKSGDVLIADSNTGWTMHEAARVVQAVRDLDVYIEQPCRTYEECLTVRRRTALPFILDENIDGIGILLRAIADGAMDVINLKISKVGGLTRAREMRDLCISAGVAMTIEDTWGGDIVTAAIAHLARSTPDEFLFSATDFNCYVTRRHRQGRAAAQRRPHDRARPPRPRHRAAAGCPGQAGAERRLAARGSPISPCPRKADGSERASRPRCFPPRPIHSQGRQR